MGFTHSTADSIGEMENSMKSLDHQRDESAPLKNVEKQLNILFIEDQLQDMQMCVDELKMAGFNFKFEVVEKEKEISIVLQNKQFDIVLYHQDFPGCDPKITIQQIKEHVVDAIIIMLGKNRCDEKALSHIQDGASDYLLKGHLARLPFVVRRALYEQAELKRRIKAEKDLNENVSKYRALVENSFDALVLLDQNGQFIYVSSAFERLTGYSAEELLHTDRLQLVPHLDDRKKAVDSSKECLQNPGKPVLVQVRMKRKDGEIIWLDIIRTNRLEDENVRGVICNIRDITSEKEATEKIIEKEAMFRSLVENAPYGIYRSKSSSNHFLSVNPALVSMLGYANAEELLKAKLFEDIYVDPNVRQKILDDLKTKSTYAMVLQWKRKDGKHIHVRLVGNRIHNPADQAEVFEVFADDITSQLQMEHQLRQSQKMEAVGLLAGGIAHDFNNLLGIIIGQCDLLQEKIGEEDPLQKRLQEISKAGVRAAALTRQLLLFSKKEKAEIRLADLNHVVQECQKLLDRLIGENITLNYKLQEGSLLIEADQGQLGQVLMNLVINARDAITNHGTITIRTSQYKTDGTGFTGLPPGEYVWLVVQDDGSGMTDDIKEHIFEPFYTTKKDLGTGLGLSTAYGIVKQHKGYIHVASEIGVGTTFTIVLPLAKPRSDESESLAPEYPSRGKVETILLAEDEPAFRALVSELLEDRGYNLLQAPHGAAALEMAELYEDTIHLLITDVIMPEMNGAQLATKIKVKRPDLKVLFISGYTDDVLKRHGTDLEGVPLLSKPFTQMALAAKIREVLDGK